MIIFFFFQAEDGIRDRDTEGTASSFGDVPSHTPHAVPGLYGLVNEISRCRALSGSAFGSRYEGGATSPAVENADRNLVNVCPLRDVAPPRCKPQLKNEPARLCGVAGVRGTS